MTWRHATITGYVLVVAAALALELCGRRAGSRVPRLGTLLAYLMRTRSGRMGMLAGWAWLGLHLFAK